MTSLLDIGPLTEEVTIRGTTLAVQGLTAGHLFQLFTEFPEIKKIFEGNKSGEPVAQTLIRVAPNLIGKIIALALGEGGNEEIEAKAKTMGAADQLAILNAVQALSFPDGLGPFMDQITKLLQPFAVKPALTQSGSSNGAENSQRSFSASLQMDTPHMMRGPSRLVN